MRMLNLDEIKRRRELLQLTMEEAATAAGLKGGRQKWHDLEAGHNGNPKLDTLKGMANALRCSIAELVIEPYPCKRRGKGRDSQATGRNLRIERKTSDDTREGE
jgi:transcriptional regulator with XRE-family HTH domain